MVIVIVCFPPVMQISKIGKIIGKRKFAARIGVQYTMLNEILNSKRPVNVQFAMLVEAALGIDAELWIKMQARYNMLTAKKDKSFAERLAKIRNISATL